MNVQVNKIAHLKGHDGSVYSVGSDRNENAILSAGSDRMVVEWNLDSFVAEHVLARTPGVIYCTCIIPEYNLLLVGNDLGGIHVIDLEKKAEVRYLLGHAKGVFALMWNPFQEQVYSSGGDGHLVIWNVHDFQCIKSLALCDAKIRAMSFSPINGLVAVACGDNFIRIFSSISLEMIHAWEAHSMSVNALCFHPNGQWLLSGSKDAFLKIWDINDDYSLHSSIPAHNYAIYSIVFHPDGHLFATGSRDKTIKIWNAETLEFLLRIDAANHQGHINSVNSLLWTSHKEYLISGSDDRSLIVWEVTSEESL